MLVAVVATLLFQVAHGVEVEALGPDAVVRVGHLVDLCQPLGLITIKGWLGKAVSSR